MDAVNPDYMLARLLADQPSDVPVWILPGNLIASRFPVLVQLYHGALPYYLGAPTYLAFGTGFAGILAARVVFGLLVLAGLAWFFRAYKVPAPGALAGLLLLAADPAFVFGLRTQFYITLLPIALMLASLALLRDKYDRVRLLLSGLAAGLAVYGYFIYALPLLAVAAVVLLRGGGTRSIATWMLGAALGLAAYAIGYALIFLAAGDWTAFQTLMQGLVQGLEPDRSKLTLADRAAAFLSHAQLALDNGGNSLMLLGAVTATPAAAWRWYALAALAVAAIVLSLRQAQLRSLVGMLCALGLGFFGLALVFGDRLWVHHYSALPVLAAGFIGVTTGALFTCGRLSSLAALAAILPLAAASLLNLAAVLRQLEATGGVGLSSDAIVRFAEAVTKREPTPAVVTPDWGVFMPLAMISQGHVPIMTDFNPQAMRERLCRGQDVSLALLAARGTDRIEGFTMALGWGQAVQAAYAQRDGVPVLIALTWRAADRPNPAPCGG